MKTVKVLGTMLFAMLVCSTAWAQWKPSDTDYTSLDKEGTSGQMIPRALHTPEGKTVLTWLRYEGAFFDDPPAGFFLHLQIFDAEGKALFDDGGLLVSKKPTASFTSNYSLALAPNGDILIAFLDTRNDANKNLTNVYVYRYDQTGKPVWSADGVKVASKVALAAGSDHSPSLCVSGNNIYLSMRHMEEEHSDYQVVRLNDDGTPAWTENLLLSADMLVLQPAPDGGAYLIYNSSTYGIEAQRINKDGQYVWATATTVETGVIGDDSYVPAPQCTVDEEGCVVMTYRLILILTGYEVYNRLTPDGKVLSPSVLANGSTENDAGSDLFAIRGQQALIVWKLVVEPSTQTLYTNLLKLDGSYAWKGGKEKGFTLDAGSDWDYHPVAVIPQSDGWVILYGDATEWNSAKFLMCKISDEGEKVWSKQLAEADFRSSGFAVVNDDKYAYIFFTREEEYDDHGEVIPNSGGIFVMCVDITKGTPTGISATLKEKGEMRSEKWFNLNGQRVGNSYKGVVVTNGKKLINK